MLARSLMLRSLRSIGIRYFVEEPTGRERMGATNEDMVKDRRRTMTTGEAITDGTNDPQFYHTTLDDNYQKTTVTIINKNVENNFTAVGSLMQHGFRMHDGTVVVGPIALFPKVILSWMVPDVDSIDEDSLTFFTLIQPRLDLLIIGVGDKKNIEPVRKRILPFLKRTKLHAEILATEDACATYNYLNSERRYVAAALFPPDDLHFTAADMMKAQQHYEDSGSEKSHLAGVPLDLLGMPKFKGTPGIVGNVKGLLEYNQRRLEAKQRAAAELVENHKGHKKE